MIALPSPWQFYGLVESPFITSASDDGRDASPVSSIIGRDREVDAIRARVIRETGGAPPIHVVMSAPGVGRTTVVRLLKDVLRQDGFFAADVRATILPEDSLERVFGRVLGALHDTLLLNCPELAEHQCMRAAGRMVLASRLGVFDAPGSEHDLVERLRTSLQQRGARAAGGDLLESGPALVRDLGELARSAGASGLLLHLHVAEHMGEDEVLTAADTMHALRAMTAGVAGLRWVVTSTSDNARDIFDPERLPHDAIERFEVEPLEAESVLEMLRRRYEVRRVDASRRPSPPVTDEAVEGLVTLYRGDLHGVLAALHHGVAPLLGLAGVPESGNAAVPSAGHPDAVRPVAWAELATMLQSRYAARLAELPNPHRRRQLALWGTRDPEALQSQKSLAKLWNVSQAAVSGAMVQFGRAGYVLALPRRAGEPAEYALSGVSRLIFG